MIIQVAARSSRLQNPAQPFLQPINLIQGTRVPFLHSQAAEVTCFQIFLCILLSIFYFPGGKYSFNPPRLTASHSAGLISNLTIINELELAVRCSHKMGSGSSKLTLMYSKQVKWTAKIRWGSTWVSYKHWWIKIIKMLLGNSRTISPLESSGVYCHCKRLC